MAGKIVETAKFGKGKTKNEDKPVGGKIKVYLDSGKNLLCHPQNLTVIGYWDIGIHEQFKNNSLWPPLK